MYANTDTRFEIDEESTKVLSAGWHRYLSFCGAGTFSYAVFTDDKNDGFDVYVITPGTDPTDFLNGDGRHYPDCGAKQMRSFVGECTIPQGARLLIDNYESHPIRLTVIIENKDNASWPDMTWDSNSYRYDENELREIYYMFH